jgi:hypothetical protein
MRYMILAGILMTFLLSEKTEAQDIQPYLKNLTVNIDGGKTQIDHWLIEVPKGTKTSTLINSGLVIERRIADIHFVVRASAKNEPLASATLLHTWPINEKWKLSDRLLFDDNWPETVTVKTTQSPPYNANWRKLSDGIYLVKIKNSSDQLSLIDDKNIVYIGVESNTPLVESRVLDLNLNPNKINVIHNQYPDLNGAGIVVSIKEQAYQKEDIDLIGRDIASDLTSTTINNHASEMATIIAGAGNSFITGRGVAKAASITSSDFTSVLPDQDSDYQSLNAMVQNHSYGTEIENFYGSKAEAFDQSANNNPALLHVFSSGNSGESTAPEGIYKGIQGYANLSGNYKMAKNLLIVGSVDTIGSKPFFVSNGPAYDGRVKPDIVSYSAVGSSNSSALVSGLAVLMQEQYKRLNSSLPSSALVKAIMVNDADDVRRKGVDYETGYGNVNGYKCLETINEQRYLSGEIDQGGSALFNLTIPANAINLKITLVWNDPKAQLNASKALVNDLDLSLMDGTSTYLPWVLDPTASLSNLEALPTRGIDRLNNVEQTSLEAPQNSNIQVTVSGFDISQGPQKFYIAYRWEIADQFQWTFPTSSDNMPYNGESNSYFRWESSLAETTGQLQYSIDNGSNWMTISQSVNLKKGFFSWSPPNTTEIALARIVTINGTYDTDPFTISRTLKTYVGFNCTDSVLLQWKSDPKAIEYELLTMDEGKYLETLNLVQDTSIVIHTDQITTTRFSIKPKYLNNLRPIGSETFDFQFSKLSCFLKLFSGEVVNESVGLKVELDLTYGVDKIVFKKLINNKLVDISNVAVIDNITETIDNDPLEGLNKYQATVHFDNGATINSDTIYVYYLNKSSVLVFPNPISSSDFLNIYTKEFGGEKILLNLYNRNGQLELTQILFSERNSVLLPNLSSGMYFYVVETPDGPVIGKLIIINQ